jgi:uracil DNA glycosylase
MLNDNQKAMRVLLATTHLQHWRNEGNAFLDHILTVDKSWMHSFDPQLK